MSREVTDEVTVTPLATVNGGTVVKEEYCKEDEKNGGRDERERREGEGETVAGIRGIVADNGRLAVNEDDVK